MTCAMLSGAKKSPIPAQRPARPLSMPRPEGVAP